MAGADVKLCSVDGKRCGVEAVPADGCGGFRLALFAGERDVDDGGDVVDELVTGEG